MKGSESGRRLHGSQLRHEPEAVPDLPLVHTTPPAELAGSGEPSEGEADWRLYGAAPQTEEAPALSLQEAPIRVLIADDHAIVRDGVIALLKSQRDMQPVGEAVDGKEAVNMVRELSPDVVLMDLRMPIMDGLEATRRITAAGLPARVLMLSQYDDEPNVTACSKAGAFGFIPKTSAGPFLLDGIRSVSRGVFYRTP